MDTRPEITTLFLDIGGVLLTNSWDRDSRRLAAETFDLDLDDLHERHHLTFDTFEEGKIDLDCYLDRVVFFRDREFSREQFKQFMFDQSKPLSDMIDLMTEIRREHSLRVAAVSNDATELVAHRVEAFHLKALIDFFVCSCFVHFRKPDEDIFRIALQIAQVEPEHVVYVDDRLLFVEVAKNLGLHAIHHTGYESTRAALSQFGLGSASVK